VIGLGYVGLPRSHRRIEPRRVGERGGNGLRYTSDLEALRDCNVFVVTVPTPIDAYRRPDLTPLLKASETVGQAIQPTARSLSGAPWGFGDG